MPRTLIVSNRLPSRVLRTEDSLTFQPSEGGLETGLGSISRTNNNVWVGWPGLFVQDEAEQAYVTEQLQADSMAPVFTLAVGDDCTDEDTFQGLPAGAYTVRVDLARHLAARYHVDSPAEVR
ncbi:hypothetical protein DNI29_21540 [Hymenobacter sediminis]|uniref:hypothetical protein n=1 Tax=Hymenobacter sediminis TaxID=2218621 RepID=UPI000DA684F5|nr:hypothetical protein [Hymenobacter sediminis]RPD44295.1 hypothetical protein DNI29_21540 [Hymenobacter sediminis]